MSESISAEDGRRAPRVKLAGVVLALIQLENGRQIRSRLHQLSITGGLLYLDDPLDEGIKVEVMFHVGNGTVRSKAAMLFPMWATQGCLQPFEFTDLAEDDRRTLESDLGTFLGQSSSASYYRGKEPWGGCRAPITDESRFLSACLAGSGFSQLLKFIELLSGDRGIRGARGQSKIFANVCHSRRVILLSRKN